MTRPALTLASVLIGAAVAHGHGRSVSYSTWLLGAAGARIELRLAALDVTATGLDPWHDRDAIGGYVLRRLTAHGSTGPCTASRAATTASPEGTVVITWEVRCGGPLETIESRLLTDVAPSHLHFARVVRADGEVAERVLSAGDARWTGAGASRSAVHDGSTFADYVRLGVDHIATGYDHLAFVLALVLLAGSLAEVATIVSAFTVAHSLTLAAAVLDVVRPEPVAVEALIGFSIALVATENAWLLAGRDRLTAWLVPAVLSVLAVGLPGRMSTLTLAALALFSGCHLGLLAHSPSPTRLRAVVAFGFGLVHGFAFAGVLADMALPPARLVPALLGFNVGVELGQLAVVTVAWLALGSIDRLVPRVRRPLAELGSATIAGIGLFWFVTRGWG